MGLLDELDYTVKPANRVQRMMQRFASSRPGSRVLQRTLYRLDKALFKLTGGRMTVPSLVTGLPVILLTTTGAKSGQRRTMPLVGVPYAEHLAVVGSNYGQRPTPGWVYNLEADAHATVTYRGRAVEVTARPAVGDEVDEVFELGAALYGGFGEYRGRAGHRVIRVFVLESRA